MADPLGPQAAYAGLLKGKNKSVIKPQKQMYTMQTVTKLNSSLTMPATQSQGCVNLKIQ